MQKTDTCFLPNQQMLSITLLVEFILDIASEQTSSQLKVSIYYNNIEVN